MRISDWSSDVCSSDLRWGPPWLYAGGEATSAYYLCANRGKEAIAVDFTDAEGQQIIRDLAAGCDVVVEYFKVGTLKRYGLDAARLREANPALVYCSVTRSEEHTSELQSLMRNSYAVFCMKKKKNKNIDIIRTRIIIHTLEANRNT